MANEIEISNAAHATDVISDGMSAALVQAVVCLPLIYTENLPVGTAVKLFRKAGSLTAEAIAESGSYSFSASSELTEASTTSTSTKYTCVSKLTVEAQQFTDLSIDKIAAEQGRALARDIDDDILALNTGATNSVTASSVLTVDDVMDAVYNVQNGTAGVSGGQLVGWFGYKAINSIRKELLNSGAAVWAQPTMTSLLDGRIGNAGYVGSLPGIDLYVTNGHPTSASDDVQLCFDPAIGIAGCFGPVNVRTVWVGSGGHWDEVASYLFGDCVEWNDGALCKVLSDT